jgi:nucleoside 2-deoxyribosyltransferase
MEPTLNYEVYLAGAMERRADYGVTWRAEVAKKLRTAGVQVYSPTEHENVNLGKHGLNSIDEFRRAKSEDTSRYVACMRDIIKADLDAISGLDAIVVLIDKAMLSYSGGTAGELTYAFYKLGIPVYAVLDDVKVSDVPGWIIGTITEFHDDFDSVVTRITQVAKDADLVRRRPQTLRDWLVENQGIIGIVALILALAQLLSKCEPCK